MRVSNQLLGRRTAWGFLATLLLSKHSSHSNELCGAVYAFRHLLPETLAYRNGYGRRSRSARVVMVYIPVSEGHNMMFYEV